MNTATSLSASTAVQSPAAAQPAVQPPSATPSPAGAEAPGQQTRYRIIGALSFSHLLNDMLQSLLIALYPLLKGSLDLTFAQIGLITLVGQLTASLFQPLVGLYTDRHPKPYSLAFGMCFTLVGLVMLSMASDFYSVLAAAALFGTGSSVFHPEASRIARMASGGRHGMAQSVFQIGGNFGSAIGPLLAATLILPFGQGALAWFLPAALLAIFILFQVGNWYKRQQSVKKAGPAWRAHALPRRTVVATLAVLVALMFSKFLYLASLNNYYTFYLIDRFGVSVQSAQLHLFAFLLSGAAGLLLGGPIADRIGRKYLIWVSILGVAPFTLLLPHVNLFWTSALAVLIGLVMASAFSAILVYAQELVPGKVGTVSGLFFGFAFGMGGLGAAALGKLIDMTSIGFVFQVCAFLPLIGLVTVFLPDIEPRRLRTAAS